MLAYYIVLILFFLLIVYNIFFMGSNISRLDFAQKNVAKIIVFREKEL